MITDTLYDAAFAFRKAKLWDRLYDSEIFALRHADGAIGYCCVMGMMGEHLALAIYPGEEGLAAYRRMGLDRSRMNEFESLEITFSQDCVMCSFEARDELRPKELADVRAYAKAHGLTLRGANAYPRFQRFSPGLYPWYLEDAQDQAHLLEGLRACMEVSERLETAAPVSLGFVDDEPFDHDIPLLEHEAGGWSWRKQALPTPRPVVYPTAEITDELRLERIRKAEKPKAKAVTAAPPDGQPKAAKARPDGKPAVRGKRATDESEWACDVVLFPRATRQADDPADEGKGEEPLLAPFFPLMMIIVDNASGYVLHMEVMENVKAYAPKFGDAFLAAVEENGLPARLYVPDDRAYALLADITEKLGIPLKKKKTLPKLAENLHHFYKHTVDSGDEDGERDEVLSFLERLNEPAYLAQLPDDALWEIAGIIRTLDPADLPENLRHNISAELRRRGSKQ